MSRPRSSTRAWRRTRAFVLQRDRHTCQKPVEPAGAICGEPATDAGHIVAHVFGGTDHPSNLRAECESHNSEDGARVRDVAKLMKGPTR